MVDDKVLHVVFYQNESGKMPVLEWLKNMSPEDRKTIGSDIKTVEFGWPLGMPLCRNLGDGIFEVRVSLHTKIARVFFCVDKNVMFLLHGIIKKSRKTPKEALDLAKNRKRRLYHGCRS